MTTLTLRPNGDTTTTWIRNTGSYNYAVIDEAVADDADYMNNTLGGTATDVYAFPDHSAESGTINSVKIYARCKEILVGTLSGHPHIHLNVLSGVEGTEQALTTSWVVYTQTWTTNPSTSAAWTWANIDAISSGITGTGVVTDIKNYSQAYCSQLYVEVDYTAVTGWANIKNSRMGTGLIAATDLSHIWFGTTEIAVADFDQFNGVTV